MKTEVNSCFFSVNSIPVFTVHPSAPTHQLMSRDNDEIKLATLRSLQGDYDSLKSLAYDAKFYGLKLVKIPGRQKRFTPKEFLYNVCASTGPLILLT